MLMGNSATKGKLMDNLIPANHAVDRLQVLTRRSSQDTIEVLSVALAVIKNNRTDAAMDFKLYKELRNLGYSPAQAFKKASPPRG